MTVFHIASGCIRSTPTFMLPVVSGIMPPDIRRNKQCLALSRRAEADDHNALHNIVTASTPGRKRLQSGHPFSEHAKQLTSDAHGKTNRAWAEGTWETRWDTIRCRLRTFIQTPSNKPIGHDLARHSLVRLNRIRTGYGRFNANTNQMGLSPSASCECVAIQTRPHNTSAASVRCTVVKETWWCWTLQQATGSTTCSVTSKNNLSIKRKKKKMSRRYRDLPVSLMEFIGAVLGSTQFLHCSIYLSA